MRGYRATLLTVVLSLGSFAAFLAHAMAQPAKVAKLPPRLVDPRGLSFDLRDFFTAPETASTLAQVVTPLGTFSMELLEHDAPRTVENFFAYVGDAAYRNALFHRSIPGFVIQTGGFSATLPPAPVATRPSVT
jgi:hypothetical protein